MRTDIAYVNGLGERVEFGGSEEGLHYFEHELRNWSWEWSTGSWGGAPTFARRPSKPREVSFPVGIAAPDGPTGIALRNRVEAMGEYDVVAGAPGRLYVGDWYVRCWVVGCSPTDYWMDDRFAELDLTVLVADPGWVRDDFAEFVPETGGGSSAGTDFPTDFPLEFKRDRQRLTVYNGGMEAQDFLWEVDGPATSPAIEVGGNLYKVNIEVPANARLEVDSAAKTVRLVHSNGTVENAYASREPGAQGSGSYIFERIAPGVSDIDWANDFVFRLTRYEVRSACPWEER